MESPVTCNGANREKTLWSDVLTLAISDLQSLAATVNNDGRSVKSMYIFQQSVLEIVDYFSASTKHLGSFGSCCHILGLDTEAVLDKLRPHLSVLTRYSEQIRHLNGTRQRFNPDAFYEFYRMISRHRGPLSNMTQIIRIRVRCDQDEYLILLNNKLNQISPKGEYSVSSIIVFLLYRVIADKKLKQFTPRRTRDGGPRRSPRAVRISPKAYEKLKHRGATMKGELNFHVENELERWIGVLSDV